jgi:hypothetical protein
MVMQRMNAKTKCDMAIQIPPVNIQAILKRIYKQPLPLLCETMDPPKGHTTNPAILKHCRPNGMPIMVKHSSKPPSIYPRAETNPPKMNHMMFPIVFKIDYFTMLKCTEGKERNK